MVTKVINRMRLFIWKICRKVINRKNVKRLHVKDTSVISMNCNGGILSHDLKLQFLSPTINLYFSAEDFIKFCENLGYYLSIDEFVECKDTSIIGDRQYPIAKLGDITLYLVHYNSLNEAQEKWNERKKRINWNNIAILNTDREGMTEELKDRFENLPYKKVMFTHLPDKKHASCFHIKSYESEECVGIITEPVGWLGKRSIDQFDYVGWLNN